MQHLSSLFPRRQTNFWTCSFTVWWVSVYALLPLAGWWKSHLGKPLLAAAVSLCRSGFKGCNSMRLLSPAGEYFEHLTIWGHSLAAVLPCMVSCFPWLWQSFDISWDLRLQLSLYLAEDGMRIFSVVFRWFLKSIEMPTLWLLQKKKKKMVKKHFSLFLFHE